jgi:phosphoglycerate dehydrogenase-like enzyme
VKRAWVPEMCAQVNVTGVDLRVYRSLSELEAEDHVQFLVPPYMGDPAELTYLENLTGLQVCQLLTAGFEHVLAYLPQGVTLCNAAGVHDSSTAELALGLIIASQRGIDNFARNMPTGEWGHQRYPSLADREVLIIGAGGLGTAIQRRLVACEAHVRMVATTKRDGIHGTDDLPALLPQAEIVVLAVPLNAHTHGMVDQAFLATMRDGALLVNMARGPVVVTEDLTAAVRSGRVRAALDVTDPEPLPPDHPLWQLPSVLISPHVGGNSTAFLPRAHALLERQLDLWARGEPLVNVVATPAPGGSHR